MATLSKALKKIHKEMELSNSIHGFVTLYITSSEKYFLILGMKKHRKVQVCIICYVIILG